MRVACGCGREKRRDHLCGGSRLVEEGSVAKLEAGEVNHHSLRGVANE